mgnify:CR=1 FL=1|jgi:hypothetical protein
MKSTDASPPYETSEIGTPLDYTTDLYRFYFEIRKHDDATKKIILKYIGPENSHSLTELAHGYEVELPIQCVPDIVQELANANIAVYQVVRYAKTNGTWHK